MAVGAACRSAPEHPRSSRDPSEVSACVQTGRARTRPDAPRTRPGRPDAPRIRRSRPFRRTGAAPRRCPGDAHPRNSAAPVPEPKNLTRMFRGTCGRRHPFIGDLLVRREPVLPELGAPSNFRCLTLPTGPHVQKRGLGRHHRPSPVPSIAPHYVSGGVEYISSGGGPPRGADLGRFVVPRWTPRCSTPPWPASTSAAESSRRVDGAPRPGGQYVINLHPSDTPAIAASDTQSNQRGISLTSRGHQPIRSRGVVLPSVGQE